MYTVYSGKERNPTFFNKEQIFRADSKNSFDTEHLSC